MNSNISRYLRNNAGYLSEYFLSTVFDDKRIKKLLKEADMIDWLKNSTAEIKRVYSPALRKISSESTIGETNRLISLRILDLLGYRGFIKDVVEDEKNRVVGIFKKATISGDDFILISLNAYGTDLRTGRNSPYKKMREALFNSDARFGLVSNGRVFMLVKQDALSDAYVEIDLQRIHEDEDREMMKVFLLLFGRRSFVPFKSGKSLIEIIEEMCKSEAEAVGDSLRDGVYSAVELLMQEVYRQNNGANLKELFEESLIYMFRLLFLFYAESTNLLPVDIEIYRDGYGITELRERIIREEIKEEADRYFIWETLNATSSLINSGLDVSEMHIEPYNGGLFDLHKTEILNDSMVSDRAMIKILKLISLTPERRGKARDRVSFRELGISQLGSVYESLLELEPKVAEEDLTVVKDGKELKYIPKRAVTEKDKIVESIAEGDVYLSSRGGTRKSTGTYYTPPQVTEFLVKKALEEQVKRRSPDQILDIKVVDPAMGSGAFLVAAVNYLGEKFYEACMEQGTQILSELTRLRNRQKLDMELEEGEKLVSLKKEMGELEERIEKLKEEGTWLSDLDPEMAMREVKRRVLEQCIYGVDINPLAVDLAKVSLWLTALDKNKPLTFLDHKLRKGNSLIGTSMEVLKVYNPDVTKLEHLKDAAKEDSDIKRKLKLIKDTAKNMNKSKYFFGLDKEIMLNPLTDAIENMAEFREGMMGADEVIDTIKLKEKKWGEFLDGSSSEGRDYVHYREIYDLWTALWFWEGIDIPTPEEYLLLIDKIINRKALNDRDRDILTKVNALREKYSFFHWELEFPEVFEKGGFDAVVGNPPWDTLQPESDEFFSNYEPLFRGYKRQEKERLMKNILESNPDIMEQWESYKLKIKNQSFFFRSSGFYPHLLGKLDLYNMFLERFFWIIRNNGTMSIIVPSGLYTDEGNKELRKTFLENSRIQFLIGIENREGIFSIHKSFKFALFSTKKEIREDDYRFKAGFFISSRAKEKKKEILDAREVLEGSFAPKAEELENLLPLVLEEGLEISRKLIERFSPDSLSIMEFKRQEDIDLAEKIYGDWPLLGDEVEDSWNVKFTQEFNMTSDSHLFVTRDELESAGARPLDPKELRWELENDAIVNGRKLNSGVYLPLYEGKMIWQFDAFYDRPQYWINENDGFEKVGENSIPYYRTGFRDTSASTNERTMVSSVIPRTFHGNTIPTVKLEIHQKALVSGDIQLYVNSIFSSILGDWVLRNKVTTHLNFHYVKTLSLTRLTSGNWFFDQIVPRAARLTCVDEEFAELWEETFRPEWKEIAETSKVGGWENLSEKWTPECGVYGWKEINGEKRDDGDRAQLRAEIDTLVAHLYGLTKEEFAYILDTFPVLRRKEQNEFGEYRTKRMCLEEYERIRALL